MMTIRRSPFIALVAIFVMVAAACSSGSTGFETVTAPAAESDTSQSADPPADEPADEPAEAPAADSDPSEPDAEATEEMPEASEEESEGDAADEPEPDPEPPGENQLPAVDVIDLATGETVSLASFAPADRPIVLWFWAPH